METPSLFEQAKTPVAASATANEIPAVLSVGVFQKTEAELNAAAPLETARESWFARFKKLFGRKKAVSTAMRPVQTEWMLDKVTVVRNDLSDCDLDVVVAGLQATEPMRAKGKSLVGRAWKHVEVPVEKLQPAETVK